MKALLLALGALRNIGGLKAEFLPGTSCHGCTGKRGSGGACHTQGVSPELDTCSGRANVGERGSSKGDSHEQSPAPVHVYRRLMCPCT
jgi:hypothetical protein